MCGLSGNGTLTINAGGTVSRMDLALIGHGGSAAGVVRVDGAGSQWSSQWNNGELMWVARSS